ncbi:MAG: ATP-binding protein [Candidatus Cloacimonetes bacterium]|nr:ATP-binding protein [Candidatus Cloacimonadota bacterium]MCF7814732.1 ATP-binding protein [Candidatus Cloacimonadota bacterium]MCF7868000.1 ATP-binding protein [Candidatus Cloacimonadota bacterium]MCF7883458.1 ATP-binding protein [Candidatus Cloacimonadota bacterium]
MLERCLSNQIEKLFFKGKAILLIGARQVGKTTLINHILTNYSDRKLFINGDEADSFFWATEPTSSKLKSIIGDNKIVFIDEAQRIQNIGLIIKIIVDTIPGIQVIASGSSAFEITNRTSEPLTGRKYEFHLYPLCFQEMVKETNLLEEIKMLNQRLVFGSYPEIVVKPQEMIKQLSTLAGSYLYKDLLGLDSIRKPEVLEKIIRALALQLGNEVNYHELSQLVGSDKQTIEKYIDLLEKTYVIFRLSAFNKNLRNELKKSRKIYFYDNGIRNAVIGNFSDINTRTDRGALWENYLISERKKLLNYQNRFVQSYFWRTFQQSEIDYVEEENQKFSAYEIKWNPQVKWRIPKPFKESYNPKTMKVIHPQNYYEFLGIE